MRFCFLAENLKMRLELHHLVKKLSEKLLDCTHVVYLIYC